MAGSAWHGRRGSREIHVYLPHRSTSRYLNHVLVAAQKNNATEVLRLQFEYLAKLLLDGTVIPEHRERAGRTLVHLAERMNSQSQKRKTA